MNRNIPGGRQHFQNSFSHFEISHETTSCLERFSKFSSLSLPKKNKNQKNPRSIFFDCVSVARQTAQDFRTSNTLACMLPSARRGHSVRSCRVRAQRGRGACGGGARPGPRPRLPHCNIEIKTLGRERKKGEHTAAVPQTDLPSATHDLHVTFSGLICTSLTAIDLTRFMQMTPRELPNSHRNQVIMYVQLSTAMKN